MRSIFRDGDLNRRYQDDGYVIVPFLTEPEIDQLRAFFDDLHPDKLPAFYPSVMNGDAKYRQTVSEAIRAVFDPKIAVIFDGAEICVESFIKKEPRQKLNEVPMHIDPSFSDEKQFMCVNVWCPLSDVTIANGCLQIVPGTEHHAVPLRPLSEAGRVDHPFDVVMPLLKAKYARDVEMAAGDALIFNGRLLHGSGPNESAEARLVAACVAVPQEAPILLPIPISPTEAELFEVDKTYFWGNQLGTRPVGVKSLGIVELDKVATFGEVDVLQSPYLRPAPTTSLDWRRWIGNWAGWKQ